MLKQNDLLTKEESRSELILEAARMYIDHKSKWKEIFLFGNLQAKSENLSDEDIISDIKNLKNLKEIILLKVVIYTNVFISGIIFDGY